VPAARSIQPPYEIVSPGVTAIQTLPPLLFAYATSDVAVPDKYQLPAWAFVALLIPQYFAA